jgi:hypothetical protein
MQDGESREEIVQSAGVWSVYLMGLRGSDGGRHFGRNVPVHLRAPSCTSIPTGRGFSGSATVPGTRETFGSESEGTASTKPRFDVFGEGE